MAALEIERLPQLWREVSPRSNLIDVRQPLLAVAPSLKRAQKFGKRFTRLAKTTNHQRHNAAEGKRHKESAAAHRLTKYSLLLCRLRSFGHAIEYVERQIAVIDFEREGRQA